MNVRILLTAAWASGAALSAQSLKPGLSLIPASVEAVEIYPRPAEFEANSRVLSGLLGLDEKKDMLSLPAVGFGVADLGAGPVFSAGYGAADGDKSKKKAVQEAPAPFLAAFPVAHPEGLLARLHAKANGEVWTYRMPGADGKASNRFAAVRPGFLLVSNNRARLEEALAAKRMIAPEVDAAAEAWLEAHDAALFVSAQETKSSLADMVRGTDSPKAGGLGSVQTRLKGLAEKAQASVAHFAIALDAAKDGSARVAFRAFFKPGSPMAQDAAALGPLGAHPLAGLPQDPFALAFGGQWPDALSFMAADPDTALAPFKGHEIPDALKADYLAALDAQKRQTQSMSMLVSPPSKADDPMLAGAMVLVRVKDAAAYGEGQARLAELQGRMVKAAGIGQITTFEKDVLPGTPSFSVSTDLSQLQGGKAVPAQAAMIFSFLFGGTTLRQTSAQLDAHTWLSVFGTAEDLKWALLRAKQNGALPEESLLKREDELLPSDSRFSFYLDLKGLRDMAQMAMSAFGKGQEPMPEVPRVPPFGLAFTCDGTGFEARGGARPESLKAMRAFFTEMQARMQAKPQPQPQE